MTDPIAVIQRMLHDIWTWDNHDTRECLDLLCKEIEELRRRIEVLSRGR